MAPRDPHEPHRVATPLELLFDLCFVVAIAQVAARLHHAIAEDHVGPAIPAFAMVFFAIWWAWMNFTWFASAYDADDTPYRAKVLLQIFGVLAIAAGVPRAFDHGDFSMITVGYTILRVGQVMHWLRAAKNHPERRATCRRYALAIVVLQSGWIAALWLPPSGWIALGLVLVACELSAPTWAERAGATPWHPHHIAERYGLLTLIVLGESVLSTTMAIQAALDEPHADVPGLVGIVAGAVMALFSMWWIYFDSPAHDFLSRTNRDGFIWGYGHIVIFGSAAAVGAGLAVAVDALALAHGGALPVGHHPIATRTAGLAVAVPCALFIASVWLLMLRPKHCGRSWLVAFMVAALAVVAAAFTPWPVPIIGAVMVALVAWVVRANARPAPTARA